MTSGNASPVKGVQGGGFPPGITTSRGVISAPYTRFTSDTFGHQILGLDLSLTATGVALPDGTLTTIKPTTQSDRRLGEIVDHIDDLIGLHDLEAGNENSDTYALDFVALEGFVVRSSASSSLGMLHGAIRLNLMRLRIPYLTVPPATLKVYATGRGNAPKPDMRMALYKRTGQDVPDDNQVDAAWLRYLGLDLVGQPELKLPQSHRRALAKLTAPSHRNERSSSSASGGGDAWGGGQQPAAAYSPDEEAGGQCDGASAGPFEDEPDETELETLRGIARRLADSWTPLRVVRVEDGEMRDEPPPRKWVRRRPEADETRRIERDPMTEAEVHAIYGTGKEDDPLAALNDARVVFWSCPEDHPAEPPRQTVEWVTEGNVMTPVCLDCGNRGPSHAIYGQKENAHE